MLEKYSSSVSFAHKVIKQMTGPDIWPRVRSSLDWDDSLFAEEDSNLFVDEVRELRLWTKIFHGLSKETVEDSSTKKNPLATLSLWALNGLKELHALLEEEDGPLGNISKPKTYYSCLQVLICANAFIQYLNTQYQGINRPSAAADSNTNFILTLLKAFVGDAEKKKVHEDLIFEVLSPYSLAKTRLEALCPEIASLLPDRLIFSLRLRRARLDPPPAEIRNSHSNTDQ